MAGSRTLYGQTFARKPAQDEWSVSVRAAIAAGATLLLAPLAVMALAPGPIEPAPVAEPDVAHVGLPGRAVELDGAIMKFSQQGDTIALSLMPSDYGQRVFVQDGAGELFEIPISPGQSNVSAELPASFAAAETLTIRVD
jgi:hypothetical protein